MAAPKPLLPPVYLLVALVCMPIVHWLVPGLRILKPPWTLAGLVPLVAGAGLNLVADRAFKRHGTTVKPFEESRVLITDGVFAVSRNPMYLGFVLMLLGVGILLGSLIPFLVPLAIGPILEFRFIRAEERMLAGRFGAEWEAYRSRVRRWI
jgi:protein-S-isoprenylcysteine O-methyltransferase Ste14